MMTLGAYKADTFKTHNHVISRLWSQSDNKALGIGNKIANIGPELRDVDLHHIYNDGVGIALSWGGGGAVLSVDAIEKSGNAETAPKHTALNCYLYFV